jgi:conjugative transfer signal peptidase TraF
VSALQRIPYMSRLPREVFPRRARLHTGMRRVARFTVYAAIPTLGVAAAAYAFGLRLNLSPSIAPGVYRVADGPIERGATVIVCLPSALATLARSRDYISAGSCPDGNAPIGKTVAAIAGDIVEVSSGLSVNGRKLSNTRPLARDHRGRRLQQFADGRYLVAAGQVWLVSTYSARSFDSRYFGPVPLGSVVSRVRPVMTLP